MINMGFQWEYNHFNNGHKRIVKNHPQIVRLLLGLTHCLDVQCTTIAE